MKDKDIEKELNKLADTWVIDGGFETFTGDDEMIARSNFKADITSLLTAQKDSFIKIIESKREDLIHHDCLVDKNTKCDCGADKWLDDIKAELERRG